MLSFSGSVFYFCFEEGYSSVKRSIGQHAALTVRPKSVA